uniref:Uncharacterized protein n=1 Tax=Arundo donax TaxID=35708 RepID=A0A0A8XQP6_ARUDO
MWTHLPKTKRKHTIPISRAPRRNSDTLINKLMTRDNAIDAPAQFTNYANQKEERQKFQNSLAASSFPSMFGYVSYSKIFL